MFLFINRSVLSIMLQGDILPGEVRVTCHLHEQMPFVKLASQEKTLMDCSRALIKKKCDEAKKNAQFRNFNVG